MRMYVLPLFFLFLLSQTIKAQDPKATPHGGKLITKGYYHLELLECNEYLELYLYGLDMDPIRNYGLSGYVDFYYPDNSCKVSKIYPYGLYGFTAAVELAHFVSYELNLHGQGIAIQISFDKTKTRNPE